MEHKKVKKAKIIYEGKKRKKTPLVICLIAIIVIAAAAFVYFNQESIFNNNQNSKITLVDVNGQTISQEELNEQWDSLPVVAKTQMTKDQLLEELIQETLLLQEAEKQNITVSDAEVEQFINMQLAQMGMTYPQFEDALTSQGTSAKEMKEIYKKQLIVAKLFDSTIDSALSASEEEINNYYELNKESFFRDEQVTVRHILVEINDAMNETQAQERVSLILNELSKNESSFCDLVQNYSSDFGSVANCGEYTFGKGQMVPEFEDAGYNMTQDEIRVIRSDYGFHVMQKIGIVPEGYIELNQSISGIQGSPTLAEGIEQVIVEQKAQEVFSKYIEELTKNANITRYDPLEQNEDFKPIEVDLTEKNVSESRKN